MLMCLVLVESICYGAAAAEPTLATASISTDMWEYDTDMWNTAAAHNIQYMK